MLIDICMKFREDSFRGFQVTERTRFVTDRWTDGHTPRKNNMSPNPSGGDINTVIQSKHTTRNYLSFRTNSSSFQTTSSKQTVQNPGMEQSNQYLASPTTAVGSTSNLAFLGPVVMPPTLKKLMGHIAFGACVSGCVGHTFCTYCNF